MNKLRCQSDIGSGLVVVTQHFGPRQQNKEKKDQKVFCSRQKNMENKKKKKSFFIIIIIFIFIFAWHGRLQVKQASFFRHQSHEQLCGSFIQKKGNERKGKKEKLKILSQSQVLFSQPNPKFCFPNLTSSLALDFSNFDFDR